jgi:hypothetical protein
MTALAFVAAYGLFKLGWIGIVILLALAAMRLVLARSRE